MKFLYGALVLILSLSACTQKKEEKPAKPTVLVTLAPYAFVVKEIAADLVCVETLIPQGANPHLYEMPPQQVNHHQKAALWFYLGENFDKKMLRCFDTLENHPKACDLTLGIALIGEKSCSCHDSDKDLHLWMSPKVLIDQTELIAQELQALLPEHQALLQERKEALITKLTTLDTELRIALASRQGSALLASHPAFAYFCRDYGLNQLSIEIEGKEPRPIDLEKLVDTARAEKIAMIITAPQHSPKGALAIADRLQLSTYEVDPYAENYEGTIRLLKEILSHDS